MVNFGRDEGACHAGITRRAFLAEEALGWETIWSGRGTMWDLVGTEETGKVT